AIVAEDFTYGHEGAGGFHLGFEAAGGKIVQKLWPPLNVPDYAPYLAQIKPDLDGISTDSRRGSTPPWPSPRRQESHRHNPDYICASYRPTQQRSDRQFSKARWQCHRPVRCQSRSGGQASGTPSRGSP